MAGFITAVHVGLCLFLIVVVLLQHGKTDMGAAFGGASQTVFGAGGAVSFLGRVTSVVAILYMGTSITLAVMANRSVRQDSVIDGTSISSPATPAPEPEGTVEPEPEPTAAPLPVQSDAPEPANGEPEAGDESEPEVEPSAQDEDGEGTPSNEDPAQGEGDPE